MDACGPGWPRATRIRTDALEDKRAMLALPQLGTKSPPRHRPRMNELDKRKEEALVVLSLSTATLIACFGIALALL